MELINFCENLPEQIRVSLGSAIVLGLAEAKLDAAPTTVYLMTYLREKCTANCGFCAQARKSSTRAGMLSRISWPAYRMKDVVRGIVDAVREGKVKRLCIQALNYPRVFIDLQALVQAVNHLVDVPISVSCQPLNRENIHLLANAGVERIGIPLDAATPEVFDRVKGVNAEGPYSWEKQWQLLKEAGKVFGEGKVSTHLIVGLGETEKEMVAAIQECVDMAVLPALFAFTPITGTALENRAQPPMEQYRRIQTGRYLILHGIVRYEDMDFDKRDRITDFGISRERLLQAIGTCEPFVTSGCPDCNRPFFNERPGGPIYNFPRKPTATELSIMKKQLSLE